MKQTTTVELKVNIREYFAGQALIGIVGDRSYDHNKPEIMAQHAYRIADAINRKDI
jgi:hypothetical protein